MKLSKNVTEKTVLIIVCIAAVVFSPLGCGQKNDEDTVLASIGGVVIRLTDFEERIANLPPRYRDVVRKRKGEYLEELVNDTLLYQEAVRLGLHKEKEVQGIIEEAKKKILVARLLKDRVDDVIVINDEDIVGYYNGNKENYMTPEIMRVSHILVPSRKNAEEILETLENGADFEETAKAKSVDPTAQRGGDIGYFPKGQLMPAFERACLKLDINENSGIVKTKLGYHIIRLTDRRLPEERSVGQVEEDIKAKLRTIKRRKIFNGLLEGLRDSTEIIINEKALGKYEKLKKEVSDD